MAYIPPNPNGNTTATSSAPVTLASDNNGPVKLYDGTNITNVLKSDGTSIGQNAAIVAPNYLPLVFTTSAVAAIANQDVGNYAWVSVQINTQGTTSTVQWQSSNDNVNWSPIQLYPAGAAGGGANTAVTNVTTTGIWHGPLAGRYFRLNVTGISAGTTAGMIAFLGAPRQTGIWNTITTIPSATNGYNGDSLAASTGGQPVFAMNGIYGGGTTVDRQRSVSAITDASGGTGLTASGGAAFNNATWDRFRNNVTAAIIAAGATTAQTSATQINYNAKKLHVVINVSAYTSGSLTFIVNAITASGFTYPLLASAAISAAGTTVLRIFPGATPSANAVSNDMVPRSFNVVVSGTFSATYGVDYQLSL